MPPSKPIESEKPSERFKSAMREILSVSKPELIRRETEYKRERKAQRTKKPSQAG